MSSWNTGLVPGVNFYFPAECTEKKKHLCDFPTTASLTYDIMSCMALTTSLCIYSII